MQKERVELFEEQRSLPPTRESAARGALRAGAGVVRVISLGISVFALIFMLCCFMVGFERTDATLPPAADTTADTSAPSADQDKFFDRLEQLLDSVVSGQTKPADTETVTPPETQPPLTSEQLYEFDRDAVPEGETAILPYDMSLLSLGESYIYNSTSYTPSVTQLLQQGKLPTLENLGASVLPADAPVVLIVHTHGTEGYSPEGAVAYDGVSELARSSDITENVVAVGAVMAETLNSLGIKTLHCQVMHDKESYRDSYSRSAATIKQYLAQYPSIKYVIDLHRDSVTNAAGDLLRPVTVVDGRAVAQVMCVVGSDESGADYPGWQENLAFALKFRRELNGKYGNISRPVCLRPSAYNQQYAPVSLLLEVGCSGNYLSEAKEAARLCALTLADMIKN